MDDLTKKQRMFVNEYLIDLNATQAAVRAGYSERAARSIGYENLTKPHIENAIQKEIQKRKERVQITQDDVVREVASLAFTPREDISDSNKLRALELLSKHTGGFSDSLEVKGEINNPLQDLTTEELRKLIADD